MQPLYIYICFKHINFNPFTYMENIKTFSLTEKDVKELIEKLQSNVEKKLRKKGEHTLSAEIKQSMSDVIINYFKKL